jgi:hypothetical protein
MNTGTEGKDKGNGKFVRNEKIRYSKKIDKNDGRGDIGELYL